MKLNTQILQEASAWFVDFSAGDVDAAAREKFNRWLRTSPEHVRAYLQTSAFWEDAHRLGKHRNPDGEALIAQALAENIVPLSSSFQGEGFSSRRRRRLPLAAVVAFLFITTAAFAWLHLQGITHATGIGEQRTIILADSSTLQLNARSRIRIRFDDQERRIDLLEGQALFEVAKDPDRPFVVRSGPARVRAVGTRFDVYRKKTATVVTVVEGGVAISSSSPLPSGEGSGVRVPSSPLLLAASEQATITPHEISLPMPVDPAIATAWTEGQLIFEAASLAEVVAEFNRYNPRRLVVTGPQLENFHVNGVFPANDPDRLVQFLRQRFAIQVDRTDREVRIFFR